MNPGGVIRKLIVFAAVELVEPLGPLLGRLRAFAPICLGMERREVLLLQAEQILEHEGLSFENLEASGSRQFEATHHPFYRHYEVLISRPPTFA